MAGWTKRCGVASADVYDDGEPRAKDKVFEQHGVRLIVDIKSFVYLRGTELDFVLRNLGVTTVVGVGVSVNAATQNLAFDAVNSSYQVVLPRDAVAGFPPEYAEAVFANTLGAVSTLVTTAELLDAWG